MRTLVLGLGRTGLSPKSKLVFMSAQCVVVGIAGGSASGKTSFTRALVQFLEQQAPTARVETLHVDDFFHPDKSHGPSFVSPSTGETLFNFNHPDAIDQSRLLDCIQNRSTAEDAPDVLLVEGLMVLHIRPVRELLDLRIFLELEADARALRRLLRDMKGTRASTDPDFIATYYLECARVGHHLFVEPSRVHADFILRGDADFSRIVPLLAATITSQILK